MSKIEWGLAIGVALLYDLLGFLLGLIYLDILLDIFAAGTFGLWFYLKGISKGKGLSARIVIPYSISYIPFIKLAPQWTLMVLETMFQDEIVKVTQKMMQKISQSASSPAEKTKGSIASPLPSSNK